jgi:hypothetical protein
MGGISAGMHVKLDEMFVHSAYFRVWVLILKNFGAILISSVA